MDNKFYSKVSEDLSERSINDTVPNSPIFHIEIKLTDKANEVHSFVKGKNL
jgi:hypothetical protein